MSKKLVSKQSNTIFNYFQSPKSKNTQNGTPTSQVNKEKPLETIKIEDEIAEEPIRKTNKKRSRVIDSDSDEENIPTTSKSTSQKFTKKIKRHSSSEDSSGADPSESKIIDKFESISKIQWLHEKLDFLEPNNIRDGKKRKMEDPEYDPHTLYVREDYLNTLTPAMRQWWVLKSKHYDSVLFFKVGKFYELYHMDAVVGVNYLGFSYMKGEFAHSGFPETAYGRMAQSLMEQGFKVARVEQTETPEMMKERCANKKCTKFDKVVNREICQVTTKGACVYGAQIRDAKDSLPSYMLAIAEKVQNDNSSRFGICFIDTSTGNINVGEFSDDTHCSKLLTLLSEHPPALVLIERNKTSNATCDILRKNAGNARIEKLSTLSQFHNAETTIRKLQEADYFKDKNGVFAWPETLNDIIIDGASKAEYELALSALGACWWYLKDSLLDIQVFTKRDFRIYKPFLDGDPKLKNEFMILDATTMENLNVLGKNGTIQKTLDFCCTAFGKRLLHQWLCRPLCNIVKVRGRQSCIQELYSNNEWVEAARNILKKLPDLNRQIMKIHTFGNKQFAEQHPDSRAIFYEGKTYASTKIFDLLNTLDGFEKAMDLPSIFGGSETQLLKQITQFTADGGSFCDLTPPLEYFKSAFDRNEAQKTGKIVFQMGVDTDFDNAEEAIRDVNKELDVYLQEQKKFFQCNVVYHGSDKKRYQLEVPENKCNRVTTDYTIESSRKGSKPVKRYSTARTKELLAKMMRAESDRASVLEDLNRRVFEKFNDWYEEWDQVAHCLAMLDVLCALAKYAMTYSQDICLPTILPFSDKPFIRIENARHPCIPKVDDYVPNDTALAVDGKPGILILTGPNMGGKSTLMRQVALIIVMAQIGSYVPAASCELTLVDRIFTRLGAQDDIMSGQSTFLVEMLESSAILQHATKHSFVLLDELGRGTSTHDGNAIATAYMRKLLEIDCRTIYSTHYHTLAQYYGKREDIQLGHMACMIENKESGEDTVTFLYKLEPGICSNSYGFNVANLAGLSSNILERAREIAKKLEAANAHRQLFIQLFVTNDIGLVKKAILSLDNGICTV